MELEPQKMDVAVTLSQRARREKQRIALISVGVALFLTGFKLIVGIVTNSLGILSEAAHSGLDLVAAFFTFVAVRISDKPADEEHPYGHGKVENFSALLETMLLFITCGWIIKEAVERLFFKETAIVVTAWSFIVLIVSIVLQIFISSALYRVARKHNSQALEADALHFQSDIWSSSIVIVGLIFARFGFERGDAIAAFAVAVWVMIVSLRLGKRTIDALIDRTPLGLHSTVIDAVQNVPGVEKCDRLRIRQSGSKLFIDMSVAIQRTLPFEKAHGVVDAVEQRLHEIIPNADILIHPEPIALDTESVADKVRMIVLGAGLTAHHIALHSVHGQYHVDLHIEYGGAERFAEVHTAATRIEEKIKNLVPEVAVVRTHIEDVEAAETAVDVTASSKELVKRIRSIALSEPGVARCEGISVIDAIGKKKVSMNCTVDRQLSVGEVHSLVSNIEKRIYSAMKDVSSVLVHAEPAE